ncbi:TRAP transporter large permease [Pseudooceanicola sp. C21-150M6]|uniref:TRAP transporter large permease n=1 Tax=Pseudooceanicola sp. C21-150M6 TaxID=3434355 RepID=UPI003D7F41D3
MSDTALAIGSFPVLLALIFLRLPIGLAMFLVGFGGAWAVTGSPLMLLAQFKTLTFGTFSNYSLSVIPLFLLMGQFATISGMSAALFSAAAAWLGHRRGGVVMAAIGACAGFGAICGSSLATASTMGQVALPHLRRQGYSGALSTGALAAGGTLGILIPPSVVLVLYAILAEQNIAKLFLAAVIPGLLATLGYMVTVAILMRTGRETGAVLPRQTLSQRLRALRPVLPVAVIFALVVGGIYLGLFTPTEGAAIGAAGTGLAALARGGLGRADLRQAALNTAGATGMIFVIILGAGVFNTFLALTLLPQNTAAWIAAQGFGPWTVLCAILLLYLVFGCVMDSISMILLTVPIFYPVIMSLDFGLPEDALGIWFGVLVLIVVEVGLITPPVGMNLYVINAMAGDIPIRQTFRGALHFVIADLLRVVLLVCFPALTLGLMY